MKLSIVIPLYNAEKYISTCLDSIFGSDLKQGEFEIVVVNDGSKDQGPVIVETYQKEHPEIQLVHQENKGQGAARNNGIEHAKGDYVWFVDADDKIRDTIHPLLKLINKDEQLDMVSFKLDVIDVQGNFLYHGGLFFSTGGKILSGRTAFMHGAKPASACTTLFRRDFLIDKNLRFTERKLIHQDSEFSIRTLALADRVFNVDDVFYYYIKRMESYTRNDIRLKKKIKDSIEIFLLTDQFQRSLVQTDVEFANYLNDYNQRILFGIVLSMLRNRKAWKRIGLNKELLSMMKNNHLYPLRYHYKNWKQNVMKRLLNIEVLLK